MGNQQQPWMSTEDRFGRRLRIEREQRGMTQADVARVLEEEHGLKLHPTAIAKMEQRHVERPRAIRLYEAQALAAVFGLTVDEMMSTGEDEFAELARSFVQLESQAQAVREQEAELFDRLRLHAPLLAGPEEEVPPAVRVWRSAIIRSMAHLYNLDKEAARRPPSLKEVMNRAMKFDRLKRELLQKEMKLGSARLSTNDNARRELEAEIEDLRRKIDEFEPVVDRPYKATEEDLRRALGS